MLAAALHPLQLQAKLLWHKLLARFVEGGLLHSKAKLK